MTKRNNLKLNSNPKPLFKENKGKENHIWLSTDSSAKDKGE